MRAHASQPASGAGSQGLVVETEVQVESMSLGDILEECPYSSFAGATAKTSWPPDQADANPLLASSKLPLASGANLRSRT
jgi:hypothetical protein